MSVKTRPTKLAANLVERPEDNRSVIERLAELSKEDREEIVDRIVATKYPELKHKALKYDWEINGRPDQLIPLDMENKWNTFVLNMGRRMAEKNYAWKLRF